MIGNSESCIKVPGIAAIKGLSRIGVWRLKP
jgi:hypothetical protein